VVGLDFTEADGPAFDQAARIAQRVPNSALQLVHVFDAEPSAERSRDLVGHLRLYVNEKAATTGGLKGITVGIHLRAGNPVSELARFAMETHADIIVLGSKKGPHLKNWILGSTAEKLVASAPCAVVIARPVPDAPEKPEPVIEPACPDWLRARAASGGAEWWCPRHQEHAKLAHTYSYQRDVPFATHDSAVIPTGIDF
jgi:nucleotide-binding universal stress UspA family protein